jgi:hypothetical protein
MITDFIYPMYDEFVGCIFQGFIGAVFVIVASKILFDSGLHTAYNVHILLCLRPVFVPDVTYLK